MGDILNRQKIRGSIMLTHPIIEKLQMMKFYGMRKAFEDQLQMADIDKFSFEERFGLIVDREKTEREDRQLKTRLRKAGLRLAASIEDIDFDHPRGLDKGLILSLASCQWLKANHNVFITGPTGVGKSYLACALAQKACRQGYSALYLRLPKLFADLGLAKGDGRYAKLLSTLAKTNLLVLDDWGLSKLNKEQQRDFLEIIEDRYELQSTVMTSQLPVSHWHEIIGDPTMADAILDRMVHNAYKIDLKGGCMRKKKTALT
jgi:DNA replication protein DnaC